MNIIYWSYKKREEVYFMHTALTLNDVSVKKIYFFTALLFNFYLLLCVQDMSG